MIEQSAKLKIGNRTLRLWLGYSTQRRLGCRTLGDFIVEFSGIFVRAADDEGKLHVVDLGTEAIERIVCAAACEVAADGETLRHAGLTVDEFRALVDADGARMADVMQRCALALEEAFTAAEILPKRAESDDKQEVGEADPDPTRKSRSDGSASSAPALG